MFIWDYEIDEAGQAKLNMARVDQGKTYRVVKPCTTVKEVLHWLKHFERLDLATFMLYASLECETK